MPTPNWWTEEDLAKLREMRANGDSIRFIARELKRHRVTIANKCIYQFGIFRGEQEF